VIFLHSKIVCAFREKFFAAKNFHRVLLATIYAAARKKFSFVIRLHHNARIAREAFV